MLNKDYVLSRDASIKQLFYIKYEVMMERLYDFTGPGSVRLSAERLLEDGGFKKQSEVVLKEGSSFRYFLKWKTDFFKWM